MKQLTQNELRCYCRREPLLAMYGLDDNRKMYVHVKVYKNRRIFGEILITDGVVHLRCRECLRWYTITLRQSGKVELVESSQPKSLQNDELPDHV